MGRFKNETGERNMIVILSHMIKEGIPIRKWVEFFANMLKSEGRNNDVGPAICNKQGYQMEMWKLNGELHEMIHRIKETNPSLIPEGIIIDDRYNLYRSFRCGATTGAKENGISEPVIEMKK